MFSLRPKARACSSAHGLYADQGRVRYTAPADLESHRRHKAMAGTHRRHSRWGKTHRGLPRGRCGIPVGCPHRGGSLLSVRAHRMVRARASQLHFARTVSYGLQRDNSLSGQQRWGTVVVSTLEYHLPSLVEIPLFKRVFQYFFERSIVASFENAKEILEE